MTLRNFIATNIRRCLNEQQSFKEVKLYHRIGNKSNLDLTALIKSVINKGLIRHDNGEIGSTIWFSDEYDEYSKEGKFVVSIDYNEKNKEKYEIAYDNHNGYAYKDIPFEDLLVIKIPTMVHRSVTSSDDLIRLINEKIATIEKLNNLENVTIYGDIFNRYVQPFINIENFINKLDSNKIKIINVF